MNKKFKRLISVILTVMMAIGMMPFSGLTTVSAADSDYIYFDTTDMSTYGGSTWSNVYIAFSGWGTPKSMMSVGNGVFRYPKDSMGESYVIFTNSNSWNTINNNDYTRTEQINSFSAGYVYKVSGLGNQIGGKNVYSVTSSVYSGDQGGGGTTPTDNKTVYFDTSGNSNANWPTTGSFYVYGFSSSGSKSGIKKMYTTNKSGIYGYTFDRQYESVIFLNKSSFTTSGTDYSSQTTNQTIPWSTYANPTFKLNGGYEAGTGKKNGTWSNNSGVGTVTELSKRFLVATDLVDFVNDARLADDGNRTRYYSNNNQGSNLDQYNEVYSYLNRAISKENYTIPLYFGNLVLNPQRHGRNIGVQTWHGLSNWSIGANVALEEVNKNVNGTVREKFYGAAAQGLVGTKLNNGRLTDPNDYNKILPYFSGTSLKALNSDGTQSSKNVTEYYKGLEFPFKQTVDSYGVTTYSYNSDTDKAVYYDWDRQHTNEGTGDFYESDTHILNDTQNDDTAAKKGFFPLNKPGDAGDARNMGFGVKFSIPFTLAADGMINGQNVSFNFTGDDDVWVFIDNYLVLDMGGAHRQATGKIDFTNQQVTVDYAYTPDRSTAYSTYESDTSSRDSKTSEQSLKKFNQIDCDGRTFADIMEDDSKPHTLTMFYMERGMFDSNMSVSFNMDVLPSGLTLAKEVNVADVNEGLKDAVKDSDDFNFTIKANNSLVNGVTYEKESGNGTITDGNITGVKDGDKVSNFKNGEDSAFAMGTSLNIVENGATNYTTSWSVTDTDLAQVIDSNTDSKETTFSLGKADDTERTKVNYLVNFVNTPKVAPLTLIKKWQEGQTAPTDGTYNFAILVDLAGGTDYQAYDLEYTVNGEEKTTVDSQLSLKVDETATFAGIPIGASYKIIETVPEDANWSSDKEQNTVTGTISGTGSDNAVTFTNKTDEITVDKVIYVEAGKVTNYIPSDLSSESGYESLEAKTEGITVVREAGTFHIPKANEKHTVSYTGTNTEGTKVKGTITVYSYKATDDVYVFDYGLKSDLADTTHGVGMFQNDVLFNSNVTTTNAEFSALTTNGLTQSTITANATLPLNLAQYNSTSGAQLTDSESVTFEPTAFMDKKETASYETTVLADGRTAVNSPEDGVKMNATVTVMPASVVYYEDNFANEITYTGATIVNSTPITLTQSNDLSELYGHDDAYATGTGDSADGSTQMKKGAKATFTFKGTGFDLIARTSKNTGSIVYKVKDVTSGTVKYYGAVDTYYNNGDLYQLPVLSVKNMTYGTYEVTILVVASNMDNENTTFYLDGVRIYDPAGDTLNGNYIPNEAGAKIKDIRQMILGDCEITEKGIVDESGSYITSAEVAGSTASVLYYDGDEKALEFFGDMNQEDIGSEEGPTYSASLAEYLRRGPANEVYLGANSGVAFVVKADGAANPTFQVEAKLVQLSTGEDGSTPTLYMLNASKEKTSISDIKTNTAMYYDIPVSNAISLGSDNYLVVLTGDETATDCISMTNLKVKGYTVSSPADASNAELVKDVITSSTVEPAPEDYAVDVDFVKFENTVTKGKLVKAIVEVPEGSQIDGFQVYANDNAVTTKMEKVQNSNTQYRVSFMMTNAKGNYTLKFVPYKLDTDGTTKVESVTYLSKSITVRR